MGDSDLFVADIAIKKNQIPASVVSIDSFLINNLQHTNGYAKRFTNGFLSMSSRFIKYA